ncbi:MAG: hypothetical protein RIQ72_269 [Candidatus Parcubacteria bacterium]|jgi:hypothetical protein
MSNRVTEKERQERQERKQIGRGIQELFEF